MSELRLDWPAIGRDLAEHLRGVTEVGLLGRMLEDADRDAQRLGAPADFWNTVLADYDRLTAPESRTETSQVRAMIVSRVQR